MCGFAKHHQHYRIMSTMQARGLHQSSCLMKLLQRIHLLLGNPGGGVLLEGTAVAPDRDCSLLLLALEALSGDDVPRGGLSLSTCRYVQLKKHFCRTEEREGMNGPNLTQASLGSQACRESCD